MSSPTKIEALQIEHWEERLVLATELVLEAEQKLGDLSLRYSGQLILEIEDDRA